MSSIPSNSAGVMHRWGQATFTSLGSGTGSGRLQRGTPRKFFKSRFAAPSTPTQSVPSFVSPAPAPVAPSKGIQRSKDVSVFIRVRPLLSEEDESTFEVDEDAGEIYLSETKTYKFDHVLGPETSQENVYDKAMHPLVDAFCDPDPTFQNVAIFAYGQTGTGKTYTMGMDQKDFDKEEGIVPRVMRYLFQELSLDDSTLKMSFFEILNEKIFDLIKTDRHKVPLKLKENENGFTISDLSAKVISSEFEALELLTQGCQTRSTGSTAQNTNSSRSHAVFRITLSRRDNETGEFLTKELNFVDLAGSESVGKAQTEGVRRQEGVNINKGLSVLGRCISSICKGSKHIPFRDSNLTKVLRECFTFGGLTSMIACISQEESDLRETVNTLRYANDVKTMQRPNLPKHLLNTLNMSAHKRRMDAIPSTPSSMSKKLNMTVETTTPSNKRKVQTHSKQNITFDTANISSSFFRTPSQNSLETIPDEDLLADVSSIPNNSLSRSVNSTLVDVSDVRSVLSPMIRKLKDDMKREFEETIRRELDTSILHTQEMSARRSPRLLEKSTANITVFPDKDETLISGPMFPGIRKRMRGPEQDEEYALISRPKTPKVLGDITNKAKAHHLRIVEQTASPDLKSNPKLVSPPRPSMDEMAKSLGIDMNSPSFLFSSKENTVAKRESRFSKRSVRRTTMLQPELNQSLSAFQDKSQSQLRRSRRISCQGTSKNLIHPLEQKSYWTVINQEEHNKKLINILNTANMKMLQSLPGIGPKTAISLHSYRELNGPFKKLNDLKEVQGLTKTFFTNFCIKNQVKIQI